MRPWTAGMSYPEKFHKECFSRTPAQQQIRLDWPYPPFLLVPKHRCYLLNLRPRRSIPSDFHFPLFSSFQLFSSLGPWNTLSASTLCPALCTYSQINSILHSPSPLISFPNLFIILFKRLSASDTYPPIFIEDSKRLWYSAKSLTPPLLTPT